MALYSRFKRLRSACARTKSGRLLVIAVDIFAQFCRLRCDYHVARMSEESQQPEIPESELIRVRREKLERIAALGFDAFPTKADVDTTIAAVVAAYGDKSGEELDAAKANVKIAGRIMGIRAF